MNNKTHRHIRRPYREQRGAVIIAVLVCLGVAMSLLMVMASRMMLTHRQIRRQAVNNQAQLLCQAGIERARQNLKGNSYNGETWKIPSDELGDRGAAEVIIDVAEGSTVSVTAMFPLNDQMETKFQRTITVER